MTWLLAVVLKPFGALLFFGLAAFLAYFAVGPLIPNGRVKNVLYDRSIQKRHPWKFAALAFVTFYGTIALVSYLVS